MKVLFILALFVAATNVKAGRDCYTVSGGVCTKCHRSKPFKGACSLPVPTQDKCLIYSLHKEDKPTIRCDQCVQGYALKDNKCETTGKITNCADEEINEKGVNQCKACLKGFYPVENKKLGRNECLAASDKRAATIKNCYVGCKTNGLDCRCATCPPGWGFPTSIRDIDTIGEY